MTGDKPFQIIFQAVNRHSNISGLPPYRETDAPGRYLGYFENEHGEQFIFVYDRDSKTGRLWAGDYGWESPLEVVNGDAPEIILSKEERMWLQACWGAATTFK